MLKKAVLAILVLPLLALLSARPALACSCAALPEPKEASQQADAVFTGTVLAIDNDHDPAGYGLQVRFRVEDAWKGAKCGEMYLHTGLGGGDCGYAFEVGSTYLVYAFKDEGGLSTNNCSRTRALGEAGEDLAVLGVPKHDCGAK